MPNQTLTPEEFNVVQDFAEGLKEVFENYAKNYPDNITKIFMNYILDIISLHLQLAELKVERFINRMAEHYKEGVK